MRRPFQATCVPIRATDGCTCATGACIQVIKGLHMSHKGSHTNHRGRYIRHMGLNTSRKCLHMNHMGVHMRDRGLHTSHRCCIRAARACIRVTGLAFELLGDHPVVLSSTQGHPKRRLRASKESLERPRVFPSAPKSCHSCGWSMHFAIERPFSVPSGRHFAHRHMLELVLDCEN